MEKGSLECMLSAGKAVDLGLDAVVTKLSSESSSKTFWSVRELCRLCDETTLKQLNKDFKSLKKGLAFPTNFGINNCPAFISPESNESDVTIALGDLVSIQIAAHINGYCVSACRSLIVGLNEHTSSGSTRALQATNLAAQLALRTLIPGQSSLEVGSIIERGIRAFGCYPIDTFRSRVLQKDSLDNGPEIKANSEKTDESEMVAEFTIRANQVYVIECVASTGKGELKVGGRQAEIFKRKSATAKSLRLRASRSVLSFLQNEFKNNAFNVDSILHQSSKDKHLTESSVRLGMKELRRNQLLIEYSPLYENSDEFVSRITFSVAVLPTQTVLLTKVDALQIPDQFQIEIHDHSLLEILQLPLHTEKEKSKKTNKRKASTQPMLDE
mmetsp:Transcript_547/g.983  ORF Transcript_547/g.983 Transcript_547/m.983 type:complete len:385 (+) Transcript_547:1355-2509(+)